MKLRILHKTDLEHDFRACLNNRSLELGSEEPEECESVEDTGSFSFAHVGAIIHKNFELRILTWTCV